MKRLAVLAISGSLLIVVSVVYESYFGNGARGQIQLVWPLVAGLAWALGSIGWISSHKKENSSLTCWARMVLFSVGVLFTASAFQNIIYSPPISVVGLLIGIAILSKIFLTADVAKAPSRGVNAVLVLNIFTVTLAALMFASWFLEYVLGAIVQQRMN